MSSWWSRRACRGFNSRYAGKIHHGAWWEVQIVTEGSIPAMRVRYIVKHTVQVCCGFSGSIPAMRVRYIWYGERCFWEKKSGSIPAMRVRYIRTARLYKLHNNGFNSRYAGKIHRLLTSRLRNSPRGSIPAMRVRYIYCRRPCYPRYCGSIPAMRVRYISKNNGKHCH